MASGLVALLDDVAAITKLAAASLDDIGAAAGKAGTKAMGVIVDDAAVTPRYVTGFTPDRELPMIARIAAGSLRNKLVFLLPGALLLSAFAPWAITPLLMLGGAYLCFEGAEKLIEALGGPHEEATDEIVSDAKALEQEKVSGAIRTDIILSAEIMAIALADVADRPLLTQAIALALVSVAITIAVYGAVGLIVKMDDIGLHLAKRGAATIRAIGRGLVLGMPMVMSALSTIGTAAMAWVGGGILTHGLEQFHVAWPAHTIHAIGAAVGAASPVASGAIAWIVGATLNGIFGFLVGGVIALAVHAFHKVRH